MLPWNERFAHFTSHGVIAPSMAATAWLAIRRGELTAWLRLLAGRFARKVLPAGLYQRLRDVCHGRAC